MAAAHSSRDSGRRPGGHWQLPVPYRGTGDTTTLNGAAGCMGGHCPAFVGARVPASVGCAVGAAVGLAVVGLAVVGIAVSVAVGWLVGLSAGFAVCLAVGSRVGLAIVVGVGVRMAVMSHLVRQAATRAVFVAAAAVSAALLPTVTGGDFVTHILGLRCLPKYDHGRGSPESILSTLLRC